MNGGLYNKVPNTDTEEESLEGWVTNTVSYTGGTLLIFYTMEG